MSSLEKQVTERIAAFYLNKHQGNYEAAKDDLEKTQITGIYFTSDGILVISSTRVGRLIGKRGVNITNLIDWLKTELKMEIKIHEDESYIDQLIYCLDELTGKDGREQYSFYVDGDEYK